MMLVEFCHDGQSPEICNDSWQMGREHLRQPAGYQGSSRLTIDGLDVFSFIPDNVLSENSAFLPTSPVRNVQLVSGKMASVEFNPEYWRSRFNFPNELCRIQLPPTLLKRTRSAVQDWIGSVFATGRCIRTEMMFSDGRTESE